MPNDLIAAQFVAYKELSDQGNKEVDAILHETPFERAKREIQEQLERNQQYRAVILKNVTTFAGLPQSSIETAARSMEEVYFKKGDKIIEQDDIGDSFFVLEEGFVSVTRKTNTKDPTEHPRELARLGKNSFFGEISLLTAEPRSATITVLSDEAKCLRMTKMQFDSLLSTTNQIIEENRKQIGQSVLEAVPLFKSMTMVNKRKLLEAMIPMTYMPGSYICRQGTTGNTFFILTEGICKVTVNNSEQNEKEVARLHPGDFFGEVALIETSNRRTANVISVDSVSCLTLSRNDFNRLLKNFKVKLMEHQAMRASNTENKQDATAGAIKQMNSLANKRRISGYNTIGQRDEVRISSLLRRLTTFLTESLWNSMYHRLYRDILLDQSHCNEYGKVAVNIISTTNNRFEAVTEIQEQALRILEMDPPRRTAVDHAFILGLLKQRNHLRDRLCKMWPPHQFALLAKKVKLVRFRYLRKIVEVDTKGTCAFMILRGSVRIFTRVQRGDGHLANPNEAYSKTFYEEDLFPGEVFGEAALSGMHTRMLTALSMTNVDLLVIEDEDFLSAQDRDSVHMGTEEKSKFLAQVPMFRMWDSYKLLRLAHVLVQEDIENNVIITRHKSVSKDLYFIVNGKVDILDSLRKKHVVTTLQNCDYFGESGFCNRFVKAISSKVTEEFYAVSATKLEVLVLHESNFLLFDMSSVDLVRQSFLAKQEWRRERVKIMKMERAKVRRQYHVMNVEAHYLPQLRKQEAKEKEAAEKHRRKLLGDTMDSSDEEDEDETTAGDGKRPGHSSGGRRDDDGDVSGDDAADPNHEAMGEYGGYTLYRPKKTLGGNDSRDHIYANIRPDSSGATRRASSSPTAGGKRSTPGGSPSNSPGKSRPSSPNKKPPSKADMAYQTSLVHPLDTRLQNPLLWRPPPRPKDRVRNLEDIPAILNKEFDLLMVSAACRDARTLQKSQELILAAKRPLTAKARLQKQQLMNQPLPMFDANASTTSSAAGSGVSGQGSGQTPTAGTAATTTTTTTVVVSKMKEIMASQNIIDRRFHSDGNLETAGTHPDLLTPEEEEALTDVERAAYRRKVEAMRRKSQAASQLVGGFRKSYANLLSPSNSVAAGGGGGGGGEAKGGEAAPPKGGRGTSPLTPSSRKKSVTIFEDDLAEGSQSLGGGESLTEVDEDTNNMEDDDEVQFYIKSLQPALHRQSSAPPKYFQQQAQQDALAAATAAAATATGQGHGRGRPISARPTTARLQRQGSQKRPTSALPSAMKTPTIDADTAPANGEATGAAPSATLSGRSTILSAARPQTAPSHRRTSTSPTPSSPAVGLRFDPNTVNGNYVSSPGAVTRSTLHQKVSPFRRPSAQQPSFNPNDNLHVNLPTIPPANNRFGQGLQILPASPVPRSHGRPSSAQIAAKNNSNSNRFAVSNNTSVGYPLRLLSALDASYDDSMDHGGSLPSHSLTGHSAQGIGVREPARLHNTRPGEGGGMPAGGLLNKARFAGPSPLLHDRPHRR